MSSQAEDRQRDVLKSWIEEAVDLRHGRGEGMPELSPYSDLISPFQITEQLTFIRLRLDRLEEMLVNSIRARASLKRAHQVVKDELQQAWDTHVTNPSAIQRRVLTQEYATGKEKFAEANLATLDLQRKERKSAELLSFAEETAEVIRTLHRGLEGIRQDLLAQVRALQVESHLER